jgi:hypothetical protein
VLQASEERGEHAGFWQFCLFLARPV